ncbi:mas-related G-protein coupled receptor member H-like [Tiliqua scincoides]|uniref:mas-related G-protein coupled receptor member H-like n=1 Tax=Tiliqua scincoides TaxID=71010 RepID=UPI0034636D32
MYVISVIGVVCIFGLVGNGAVIYLLGFCMKRTPFTIYILNLAVADSGVLVATIFEVVLHIVKMHLLDSLLYFHVVSRSLFRFAYSTSQFLLTAISIDRCVSVLFPLWYQCRRPEKLSSVLCALIWLLSFPVHATCFAFEITSRPETFPSVFYAFLVNAVVCLPLIVVSTLILSVRFCFKSQQRQRGKLLTAILLTLFFFLFLAFPFNIVFLFFSNPLSSHEYRLNVKCYNLTEYGLLCASLNSFVNPLLYFLIGRMKKGLCRENLKLILQRVFIEKEEDCREEQKPSNEICGSPLSQETF